MYFWRIEKLKARMAAAAKPAAEFVFLAAAEAVVYWRIGCHVRDLARRAAGGTIEEPHHDRIETA